MCIRDRDTGAPDTRYIVVTTGDSREDVLQNSERIGNVLQTHKDEGLSLIHI